MKTFILLGALLGALASAQTTTEGCQCPLVKCDSRDAVTLCNCLNSRETRCKERCPTYVPTYLPCPTKALQTPTPEPEPEPLPSKPVTCECEQTFCAQMWPQSCYCSNAGKQKCYDQCGGEAPVLQACPSARSPTLVTRPVPTKTAPVPVQTHAPCGGGRSNYLECDAGYACIKDPYKPGCGPECDGLGICVEERTCGGFGGFPCAQAGQACVDDPRDTCDPKNGGADCGGVCVWPH